MVRVTKSKRQLQLVDSTGQVLLCAPIALGREPVGHKQREGDGRTPEGMYRICLQKANGKHGQSLGLSYPNASDADTALADKRIEPATYRAILEAHRLGRRPPWGTALGGEIYLHAGGTQGDWTQGCIALEAPDMAILYEHRANIDRVEILP